MLFLGTSILQNYSRSLGLHSPILMALHLCTWAESFVDQWTIASTRKGFLPCKMCRIMGKSCPTSCHFCNAFSVGRSLMQEKNECHWIWPWMFRDNVLSKSIWCCYCTLQLSSLHISSQTVRVCRPAHDIFHTWSLNLPQSTWTHSILVTC